MSFSPQSDLSMEEEYSSLPASCILYRHFSSLALFASSLSFSLSQSATTTMLGCSTPSKAAL